jgi:hypothetical protein
MCLQNQQIEKCERLAKELQMNDNGGDSAAMERMLLDEIDELKNELSSLQTKHELQEKVIQVCVCVCVCVCVRVSVCPCANRIVSYRIVGVTIQLHFFPI